MIHLIIFTPIIAALLVLVGAPARRTAQLASLFVLALTLFAFLLFDSSSKHAFQFDSSYLIVPEWKFGFTVGLDGLSLVMVLLSALVQRVDIGRRTALQHGAQRRLVSQLIALGLPVKSKVMNVPFTPACCSFQVAPSVPSPPSISFSSTPSTSWR